MVTKGIIKSIDLTGNTCTVHIPFFETAGNDPIIETATVSNTPGSYNGYKVGDAVWVAFEDGNMDTPVVIGKLYLGVEKEKADPRGVLNVENSTVAKSATIPADTKLAAEIDSNVPNTTVPYSSLSSVANGLNTLNTNVGQMDRDYGNRFKQVIANIGEQGEVLQTQINQNSEKIGLEAERAKEAEETLHGQLEIQADNIEAKVSKIDSSGDIEGLSWTLDTEKWAINARDTIDKELTGDKELTELNLMTIDRSGVSIAGNLRLSGYTKGTTIRYCQTDSDQRYPELNLDSYLELPTTELKNLNSYVGKYIKENSDPSKYILVTENNKSELNISPGTTLAYMKWTETPPDRIDGQYIWQWTQTTAYDYDTKNNKWNDLKTTDKVVCITGAKGEGAVVSVIESSAGTSFKKPFTDANGTPKTTTLTAHLYKGTEELDSEGSWGYEWRWFNPAIGSDDKEITMSKESTDPRSTSRTITLFLSELEGKSVYFIAYPEGQVSLEGPILGVARLGVIPLGKN